MTGMSIKSLESHIEGLKKQIDEISTMPISSFKGGYLTIQQVIKSLVDLKTIYEKELSKKVIQQELKGNIY